MTDKLTTKSQEAIAAAIQSATQAGNPTLEPAHLLAALVAQEGGVAGGLLQAVGADPRAVAGRTRAAISTLPGASGASVAQPQASRALLNVLSLIHISEPTRRTPISYA